MSRVGRVDGALVVGHTGITRERGRCILFGAIYPPFGEISQPNSAGGDIVTSKFTGQEHDEETGLYYYNARHYDPAIGRFISADSIIPNLLDAQAFNRYAYVLGNPIKYIDPTGHRDDPGFGYGDEGGSHVSGRENSANTEDLPPGTKALPADLKLSLSSMWDDERSLVERFVDWLELGPAKYVDINFCVGKLYGVAFGLILDMSTGKVHGYFGVGFMRSPGVSLTMSQQGVTRGWNFAGQYSQWGGAAQVGLAPDGTAFFEGGWGTPGWSVTGFYIGEEFLNVGPLMGISGGNRRR